MHQDKATDRLAHLGPNALTEKKGLPWYCVFAQELTGFFSLLLWFGSILCFIGYGLKTEDPSNLYLGIVLAAVVFITGCFSYYQTSKSAALMAQFKNFIPAMAIVIRDGKETEIEAAKMVPGDLCKVKGGDNIPADLRIIECKDMKVNNASLTGEALELNRKPDFTHENPLETANLAFFGTQCTTGTGLGVVINTGDRTVIGQIAHLAQSAEAADTPLSIEIHRFIKLISAVAILLGVTFFILGLIFGYGIITNLVFMIGIIVANVPEGLLATVTVSLALTAKRMATKNVLVKNLESVETLGSTSCICSDKTGTLTQNVMTVSHVWFDGEMREADVNYQTHLDQLQRGIAQELDYDTKDPGFRELFRTVCLGTNAIFEYNPTEEEKRRAIARRLNKNPKKLTDAEFVSGEKAADEELRNAENSKDFQWRRTVGDASESGLIKFTHPIFPVLDTRAKFPLYFYEKNVDGKTERISCEIPFNSTNKYHVMIRDMAANVDEAPERRNKMIIFKGAPEKVWSRCSRILVKGEAKEIDDFWNQRYKEANKELANQGERVLAFSQLYLPPDQYPANFEYDMTDQRHNFPMDDFVFVGLVSLNDPPRRFVDNSVTKCRRAGIKVIMVTGDQPDTAAAIARKVNIISKDSRTNVEMRDRGVDAEQAAKDCDAVVVHGDELAIKHNAEEELHENDPEKGRFLLNWISKREVVFARTTPSQKLLIVDGCQRAGHVVAVTGDGVNDSPAIKKADIGVAMGSGSDVAKNAADMIILDDDFSSIVNGVEEGRLIFDNLKKSIAYTLSSNIPEIAPFIFFIIFQLPLPLSTVLILCIDLGTDMVPAISFAYENPELDIMERPPRNAKRDHLVNAKLISFSYL